jgi:hypothetical protein
MDARFYFLANRPSESLPRSQRWQAAVDSLGDLWHERIPTNAAIMCHYFGDSFASDLVQVSDGFNALESATAANRAQLSESTRHNIYLLELELADQLRKGDILDKNPNVQRCAQLELHPEGKS